MAPKRNVGVARARAHRGGPQLPANQLHSREHLATHRIHAGREPGRFRHRRRALCDGVHERGGTGIESRGSPLDSRGHRLDTVRHHVAVALRPGVSQCALGRGDLLVELCQSRTQCLGAVLDGAHVGLCPFQLGIGGTGDRQPLGYGTFFSQCRLCEVQLVGQLLPRRLPVL